MDKKKSHYLVHGLFWKEQMHNANYHETRKSNLCSINKAFSDAGLNKARKEAFSYYQSLIDVLYEMQYRRYYGTEDIKHYCCKPLALKLFKQRWYLIALNEKDETRCYALDRIDTINLTEATFKAPEDFDLQTYFQDAFGIYVEPDLKTEEIKVKADTDQSNFLKGLPLHHSQRIVAETDDYTIFSWQLKPSYDFIQQLLTMNAHIEVLEPLAFREHMKALLQEMLEKY